MTSDDSTCTTDTISRRRTLQSLGAASAGLLGVGSAAAEGRTLDFGIWQTERMATAAKAERDDPAYAQAVAKTYAEQYFQHLIEPSDVFSDVNIQLRTPAISLDTSGEYDNPSANIGIRLFDFNGWLSNKHEPNTHGNVLLDTPWGGRAIGVGFAAGDDTIAGALTDSSIVDYGRELLKLEPGTIRREPLLLQNDSIVGWPEEIAIAVGHELGHNVKLKHNEGASRLIHETPAATPMTGPYLISYGKREMRNACGQPYHEVEFTSQSFSDVTFEDDMRLLLEPASCAKEHFATEARELADKQSGAAGFGPGRSASVGRDPASVTQQELEEAAITTEIPEPLHERLTA